MQRVTGALAVTMLMLAACGGPPGSFKGTVGGQSMTVKDAIVLKVVDTSTGNVGGYSLALVLSDEPNICTQLKNNTRSKDSSFAFLALGSLDANAKLTATVDAGAYPVVAATALLFQPPKNQKIALVAYDRQDNTCKSTFTNGSNLGISGSVTLSNANANTGGSASGSFDVTFQAGDHVTGDFNAPFCDYNVSAKAGASAGPGGFGVVAGGNVNCT